MPTINEQIPKIIDSREQQIGLLHDDIHFRCLQLNSPTPSFSSKPFQMGWFAVKDN